MKKILVSTDGSKVAQKAIEEAKKMQECFDADIILYTNLEDGGTGYSEHKQVARNTEYQQKVRDEQKSKLDDNRHWLTKIAAEFPNPEKVLTMVDVGDIGRRIVENSEREGVDCIILGSRGLGGLRTVLLGSVSKYVALHAKCSVLIVK